MQTERLAFMIRLFSSAPNLNLEKPVFEKKATSPECEVGRANFPSFFTCCVIGLTKMRKEGEC
jgi:hypothetical protein